MFGDLKVATESEYELENYKVYTYQITQVTTKLHLIFPAI